MKRVALLLLASSCLMGFALAKEPPSRHQIGAGHKPRIAADKNGVLHVVYEGLPDADKMTDVFYSQSTDGGVTWSAGIDISHTPGASSDPDVSVESNGAIDVAWKDTSPGEQSPDVFFSRSDDNGKTWGYAADVSNTSGASTEPAICCGSDNSIHIVWVDTSASPTNPDIYYAVSTNSGESWSKPENISKTPGLSREPDVSVGVDGTAHVAWSDTTSGPIHPDIYYSRLEHNATWSEPADVSHGTRVSAHPCLATGPQGRVYLAWQDASKKLGAADIWCLSAPPKGAWENQTNISMPGLSSEPCIAADDAGHVAIAWSDSTSGSTRRDICVRTSQDSATQFDGQLNVSNTTAKSKHPDVAVSGGKTFVVWEEMGGAGSTVKAAALLTK
ncbi:MAG TPA: sialidase family protein [Planktothrix sp.]|jgi:hypothetical protein